MQTNISKFTYLKKYKILLKIYKSAEYLFLLCNIGGIPSLTEKELSKPLDSVLNFKIKMYVFTHITFHSLFGFYNMYLLWIEEQFVYIKKEAAIGYLLLSVVIVNVFLFTILKSRRDMFILFNDMAQFDYYLESLGEKNDYNLTRKQCLLMHSILMLFSFVRSFAICLLKELSINQKVFFVINFFVVSVGINKCISFTFLLLKRFTMINNAVKSYQGISFVSINGKKPMRRINILYLLYLKLYDMTHSLIRCFEVCIMIGLIEVMINICIGLYGSYKTLFLSKKPSRWILKSIISIVCCAVPTMEGVTIITIMDNISYQVQKSL